jgi:transposase
MGSARNAEIVIAGPKGKRQYRSREERRQIVEETLQPGASVAVIARQHGVNANQVFHWRKLYREGRLELKHAAAELLPVRIAEVMGAGTSVSGVDGRNMPVAGHLESFGAAA